MKQFMFTWLVQSSDLLYLRDFQTEQMSHNIVFSFSLALPEIESFNHMFQRLFVSRNLAPMLFWQASTKHVLGMKSPRALWPTMRFHLKPQERQSFFLLLMFVERCIAKNLLVWRVGTQPRCPWAFLCSMFSWIAAPTSATLDWWVRRAPWNGALNPVHNQYRDVQNEWKSWERIQRQPRQIRLFSTENVIKARDNSADHAAKKVVDKHDIGDEALPYSVTIVFNIEHSFLGATSYIL